MKRYRVTCYWWELVPPPRWIGAWWFTEMWWNLLVHRKCSLTSVHNVDAKLEAVASAFGYVRKYKLEEGKTVLVGMRVRRHP